jgi:Fe-Mn family superoxide dismutase
MTDNRREFLKKSVLLGLTGLAGDLLSKTENASRLLVSGENQKATLPPLPYPSNALEPFIDKQTMEIHHGKHHQAYIDKLNLVPPDQFDASLDLGKSCAKVNEHSEPLLRNNLGGHYNHSQFWQMLKPNPEKKELMPVGKLGDAIKKEFTSFDNFKKEFSDQSAKIFGSGWCWLIVDEKNKLKITTTPNQDNPLMEVATERGRPVLGLDVWEHAYYLKYQNRRPEYISNWWSVVNWQKCDELFNRG